jgi:heme exporter protein A
MRLSGVGLTCIRGGREVFSGLDFQISAGEALVVTGRNGAGKSSLLRLIAGLLPASAGAIALDASRAGDLTLAEQAHYLGHRDALKSSLTVQENLAFWRDFLGGEGHDSSENLDASVAASSGASLGVSLAATGLGHTAGLPAAYLSAGQRRRLSMARLVAVKRPLWLLDEPTSTLDSDGQSMFSGLMSDHLAQGGLIVVATHSPLGLDGSAVRELRLGAAA